MLDWHLVTATATKHTKHYQIKSNRNHDRLFPAIPDAYQKGARTQTYTQNQTDGTKQSRVQTYHLCSAPDYLASDLQRVSHLNARRRLHSSTTSALVAPRTVRATIGDRTFPAAAASVWSSLPESRVHHHHHHRHHHHHLPY